LVEKRTAPDELIQLFFQLILVFGLGIQPAVFQHLGDFVPRPDLGPRRQVETDG